MSKMEQTRFFQVKPAIYYGLNSIQKLSELNLGRVCIVTDEGMVKFGLLKMITDVLDQHQIRYHVFDDVEPDPSTDIVEKGLYHILLEKPDALIALGGGSAIDSAKAIIYYCYHFKEIFIEPALIQKPIFIALPTTAGTGSEVTNYAVITDKNNNAKIALSDTLMMPDIAILDPKLIESVPAGATAATGMDVLTHGYEAYVSTENNPFSRAYAIKAIELVFKNLYDSFADGSDIHAKANMQIASCMAGIAFNSAGLGITHSIAHAIGARWHLPHGFANAIVLPYVIAFNGNCPRATHFHGRILDAMQIGFKPDHATAKLLADVKALKRQLQLPACLKEHGIVEEEYLASKEKIVQQAMKDVCTTTTPLPPTLEEMNKLFDDVYYGC